MWKCFGTKKARDNNESGIEKIHAQLNFSIPAY